MLTSAIASPIWTNFSTKPMTVVKLSDDVMVNTMSIPVPIAFMPDGVDRSEDPAVPCTKDSSQAWSCSGLTTGASDKRVVSGTDGEPTGVGWLLTATASFAPLAAQEMMTVPPCRLEDDPGDKRL